MKAPKKQLLWLKAFCALFACLLLGACASLAANSIRLVQLYSNNGMGEGVVGSSVVSQYCQDAWNLFVLNQNKEHLTYLGQQDVETLTDSLNAKKTNFRYRILDMNGNVKAGNVGKRALSQQVDDAYDILFTPYTESRYYELTDDDGSYTDSVEIAAADSSYAFWSLETASYLQYDRAYIDLPPVQLPLGENEEESPNYVLEWGLVMPLTIQDDFLRWQQTASQNQGRLVPTIAAALLTGVLGLACLIFLLVATGHQAGHTEIVLTGFSRCPWDLLLLLTAGAVTLYTMGAVVLIDHTYFTLHEAVTTEDSPFALGLLVEIGILAALWLGLCLPLLTSLAAQHKAHVWWQRTLLSRFFRWLNQFLRLIPLYFKAVLIYLGSIIAFGLLCVLAGSDGSVLALIFSIALGIAGLVGLLWWLWGLGIVRKAGQALAEGNLSYVTDTTGLPWDLQRHAQDLNAISDGMQKAVEQRMRSDRFRTELITNVSHDLKTPLTSIINYVNLLKTRNLEDEEAQKYIEVLDRKSQRLKTLTEDLVEASKASTGVLPVELQRVEATQLVRQALGEYEEKLQAAQLRVIQRYPKEGAWILADGRHLWRILDNLLSNCAKYAMPGTRIYIDVLRREGMVEISVKNISADPLNLPAEDLLRRFVRGDDSRSTSGSGLGLSIAQSLASLQGAQLDIQIDGDLFKAIISFPECPDEPEHS